MTGVPLCGIDGSCGASSLTSLHSMVVLSTPFVAAGAGKVVSKVRSAKSSLRRFDNRSVAGGKYYIKPKSY